jgi:hypothetical protein
LSKAGRETILHRQRGTSAFSFYLLQRIIFDLLYLLYLLFGLIFRGLQRADLARA